MKVTLITFVMVVLAAVIGFMLYSGYIRQGLTPVTPVNPRPTRQSHGAPSQSGEPSMTVKIYRVGIEHDEEVLRPVEVSVSAKHPMESALVNLLKHDKTTKLANPMPDGTRLLSVNLKNGTALVDLSREFTDNFHGGSETETLIVESILRTLSQFPNVKRVRLLVDGKSIDTLGHLDLSGPLDVHMRGSESGEEE